MRHETDLFVCDLLPKASVLGEFHVLYCFNHYWRLTSKPQLWYCKIWCWNLSNVRTSTGFDDEVCCPRYYGWYYCCESPVSAATTLLPRHCYLASVIINRLLTHPNLLPLDLRTCRFSPHRWRTYGFPESPWLSC